MQAPVCKLSGIAFDLILPDPNTRRDGTMHIALSTSLLNLTILEHTLGLALDIIELASMLGFMLFDGVRISHGLCLINSKSFSLSLQS